MRDHVRVEEHQVVGRDDVVVAICKECRMPWVCEAKRHYDRAQDAISLLRTFYEAVKRVEYSPTGTCPWCGVYLRTVSRPQHTKGCIKQQAVEEYEDVYLDGGE